MSEKANIDRTQMHKYTKKSKIFYIYEENQTYNYNVDFTSFM